MANHRWETSPPMSPLSGRRAGQASFDGSVAPSGETADNENAVDEVMGRPPGRHPRRWLLSFRAAVLAVSLLVGAVAGLVVFKGGGPPAEVASIELDSDRSAPPAEEGSGTAPGATGSAGQDHGQLTAPGDTAESASPSAGPPFLVVHVAGAVTSPGVVRVPSGSRTGEAVDAAGGAAPDADLMAVNLAAPLQDGAMVIVPRIGEEPAAPVAGADGAAGVPGSGHGSGVDTGSGPGQGAGTGALVNINTASLQELDALPRVGPVTAERIIAWRTEHGEFARPEDIDAVPGIGEAMLAALLPLITV